LKKGKNCKKGSIGLVLATAIITSLLVAGTILVPIQSYAIRSSGGIPNTSSLKHAIRDGVTVNLEHRDQHMNQENLCYRDNTCRQSDVGQNTLGNDNSVTGFTDQSDNLQQSAAPTTANQTAPTPTPTTATLTVIKVVNGNTTATPANFTMHVTGNNPTPANFAGSSTGTDVTLGAGAFNVTETALPFFTTTFSSDCSGTITAGQHLTCTITNTVKTCEECFTSHLTTAQITALLKLESIPAACTILNTERISEPALISEITEIAGADVANQLIACLRAAGIVFRL